MKNVQPRHILITGAAGAIGGALAGRFARAYPHAELTLVDVNASVTAARAATIGTRARALAWDLSRPDELEARWRELDGRAPVDVLVNCAGIMEIKSFAATGWSLGSKLLNIDLISPLRLMDLALPAMIANRTGCVINVSSMAGRVPIKGCTYYGAAKSGIAMASEIARLELNGKGVQIITVYPGPVYSGLESHARGQVKTGFISRNIPTGNPEPLAERIVLAMQRNEPRVVYPDVYKIAHQFLGVSGWVTSALSPDPLDHT